MSGGWETFLIAFTGRRRYQCFACGWKFRAPDFHPRGMTRLVVRNLTNHGLKSHLKFKKVA
jgi:hypothetical protein